MCVKLFWVKATSAHMLSAFCRTIILEVLLIWPVLAYLVIPGI